MTEPMLHHHHSLSAHLLLKCWNVSGTSSWRAALSGHSAAGGLTTELDPQSPSTRTTKTQSVTRSVDFTVTGRESQNRAVREMLEY